MLCSWWLPEILSIRVQLSWTKLSLRMNTKQRYYKVETVRDKNNLPKSLINKNLMFITILKYIRAERKKRRQKVQQQSLIKMVPTVEEQQIIHDVFVKTIDAKHYLSSRRSLPQGAVWMDSSEISNLIFSHPEDRNYHNKVSISLLLMIIQ